LTALESRGAPGRGNPPMPPGPPPGFIRVVPARGLEARGIMVASSWTTPACAISGSRPWLPCPGGPA